MKHERFEIVVDASPEELWRCLTTESGLASWFGTRAKIDPREGGERLIGWGEEVEMTGEITEFIPHQKLVISYGSDVAGVEEWLISFDGDTTRLTLIHSMPSDEVDDWEGFYGDMRRGWTLFLESLRFVVDDADNKTREIECRYLRSEDRSSTWVQLRKVIKDSGDLLAGMEPLIEMPPHSILLAAADRTLLLDQEGLGDDLVLYIQASTHGGSSGWRSDVVARISSAFD